MARARVFPRETRQVLTRTAGYLRGFTHTLQPYVGCQFSCAYCYVREMTVQRLNPYGLPWSEWVSPKINAPELLLRSARRPAFRDARIFCSSSTDPYLPLEAKLDLTGRCLDVMAEHPPRALVVQTRSPLVVRDVWRLARIPTAGVSFTVTTDDEKVRRAFEPDSPRFRRRLEVLDALREAKIPVQAAVSPLLPCDPERLARALEPRVNRVVLDDLHSGDGAGGSRSQAALARLRREGHESWARPGLAAEVLPVFASVLGAERVTHSADGFNDLGWIPLASDREAQTRLFVDAAWVLD